MRRVLGCLLALLWSAAPVSGQAIARLGSATNSGTIADNAQSVVLTVPAGVGFGTVGVEARGTWSGTIQVECAASTGGGTFVALTLAPRDSSVTVTSFTGNGQWSGSIAGCQRVQATSTAWTSGTATITLVGSFTTKQSAFAGGSFPSPLLGPVGNCTTAPAYSFTGDTNTGMSSPSADALCFPVGGTSSWNLTTTANTSLLPIAITQGTLTASTPGLNVTQTWNNAAVAFTGLKFDATLTASDAASLLLDLQTGAVSRFSVARSGAVTALSFSGNNGTNSFVDNMGLFDTSNTGAYRLTGNFASNVAPTIASGFGTNPSIVASNGTAGFTVNVGTGGTASAGVITMPSATTGWICHVENVTGVLGNVANQRSMQIASTQTSITVENQTISTGAALAWTASDVLAIMCMGY